MIRLFDPKMNPIFFACRRLQTFSPRQQTAKIVCQGWLKKADVLLIRLAKETEVIGSGVNLWQLLSHSSTNGFTNHLCRCDRRKLIVVPSNKDRSIQHIVSLITMLKADIEIVQLQEARTQELCQLVLMNSFYLLRFLRCGETFLLFNGIECFGGLYESDFGLWVQDS